MKKITVSIPAKINLTLGISGTDSRGYHLLDMLMHRISVFDKLTVTKTPCNISLTSSDPRLPCDRRNTAYKAAEFFFEETRINSGCDIVIEKNIPSGAGFAGGSGDGAGVLKGLNYLFGNPLDSSALDRLALKIGSDVPYMLKNGFCRVGGCGEITESLPPPPMLTLLAVMPESAPASTAEIYKTYDIVGSSARPDNNGFLDALYKKDFSSLSHFGGNALFESTVSKVPAVGEIAKKMGSLHPLYTLMTGSGSAVYGIFENSTLAKKAEENFTDIWHRVCTTVDYGIIITEDNKQ